MSLHSKHEKLKSVFEPLPGVVVAFSGGVDSTLVLAVAHSVLKENVLAVTGRSDSLAGREFQQAQELTRNLGIEHRVIETAEMDSPQYTQNPINRCFYCKTELYSHLTRLPEVQQGWSIANGTNVDDLGDYRPGLQAADNASVLSPLAEAGMTKSEVRELALHLNLPNWDKPAMPCLSSRIPYGQEVTTEKLRQIEHAEGLLINLGFQEVRVRHKEGVACIEVPQVEIPRLLKHDDLAQIETQIIEMGFTAMEIDPLGFRSGNLNEAIPNITPGD